MLKRFTCLLWLYTWLYPVQAQVETQYLFSEAFGFKEGLHQDVISDFKVDQNDLLWVSSFGRIQLFDGQRFIDMSHLVKPGAATGTFNFSNSKELFFLKSNILYKFSADQYTSKTAPQVVLPPYSPGGLYCKIIFEDSEYLYISHPNDSMYQVDKGGLNLKHAYALAPAVHKNYYWCDMYVSARPARYIDYINIDNRRCHLDLESGAIRIDSTTMPVGRGVLASGDTIVTLQDNALWVCDGLKNIRIPLPDSIQDFLGEYLLLSGRDSLYVGLRNAIYIFDLRKLSWTTKLMRTGGQPLFDIKMRKMNKDKSGHLYFSTFNTGLVKMYPRNKGFAYIGEPATDKLFIKCVRVSESQNLVLAGTIQNGLFLFDTNGVLKRHILKFPDGLDHRYISSILKISETRYIIMARQAFELNTENGAYQLRILPGFNPLWLTYYDYPIEDTIHHRFFIFNHLGILEINPDDPITFHHIPKVVFSASSSTVQIGEQYVISRQNELIYYDQDLNSSEKKFHLPEFGYSRSIVPYSVKEVLIGTDLGLYLVNTEDTTVAYTLLYDHMVYAILPGSSVKEFWFSTDFGLYHLGADMRINKYSVETGLQENEFNTNSCFKSQSGKLYFGGVNGITAFYPQAVEITADNVIPYISAIYVNSEVIGRYLSPSSIPEYHLSYKDHFVRIELLGKGSRSPLSYNYQYKVSEMNSQWINLGRDMDMQFQLSPGTYTIYYHIDDNFDPKAIPLHAVRIYISPPVYKRWWFVAGLMIVPLLMIYYLMNLSRKRQALKVSYELELDQQLHDERMRISRELHDNIGAQMATVKRNINFLIDHNDRLSPSQAMLKMQDLESISSQINQELRDTIWVVQNEHIDLSGFVTRLKNYIFQLLGQESAYRIYYEEQGDMQILLGPFIALNLHRICQESIHNILKHSQATEIRIMIESRTSSLKITIADNGIGFDPEKVFEGYGIGNIRKRAEQIGAVVHFNRLPQFGSSMEVVITQFTSITKKI